MHYEPPNPMFSPCQLKGLVCTECGQPMIMAHAKPQPASEIRIYRCRHCKVEESFLVTRHKSISRFERS